MDLKSVKQLADLMEERGLTSIEVCEGDHKISLTKAAQVAVPATAPVPAPPAPANNASIEGITPSQEESKAGEPLKAPLVGITYLAPKPGAEPFVRVGSKVKKGQPLCIIEAMKVMNEFTSPRNGEIAEICVEDGQMVEFGQCLFRLL